MINWLTDYLGTGPYLEVAGQNGFELIDVRNLVDKEGNTDEAILEKIEETLTHLRNNKKVVISCDYGMSRSNSIAIAVISKYENLPFSKVINNVRTKISEQGVKLEVLHNILSVSNKKTVASTSENRILITGGSGFIGKKLTQKLSESFFVKSVSSNDVDLINNPIMLDVIVKENNITTLIHLANPRIYTLNIAMGESLVMLKNILEICRLNQVKLIFISSWEVYSGYKAEELIADENLPVFPKGSYGETKWLSEEMVKHYHKTYDISYVILRSSPVYGENSDKPKFIYNFIDKAKKNEAIITHEYINGKPKLDLLYINDFIDAIAKTLNYRETGIFNIGSGKLYSTTIIAELIVAALKSKSKIESNFINGYYPNIKMDTSLAFKKIAWKSTSDINNFFTKLFI